MAQEPAEAARALLKGISEAHKLHDHAHNMYHVLGDQESIKLAKDILDKHDELDMLEERFTTLMREV